MASNKKKGLSDQAIQRLEESGYMNRIRAEMKAEVMKCILELEEENEIPENLRVKRFRPQSEEERDSLAYIYEFLSFHNLQNTLTCLEAETEGEIQKLVGKGDMSELARLIQENGDDYNNIL